MKIQDGWSYNLEGIDLEVAFESLQHGTNLAKKVSIRPGYTIDKEGNLLIVPEVLIVNSIQRINDSFQVNGLATIDEKEYHFSITLSNNIAFST